MGERVIIRHCDGYDDIERINRIVDEGMKSFDLRPSGQVLVKPNTVFAHRRYGRHAYTHPAVLEGIFRSLRRYNDIGPLLLGERTAVTVPTRYAFREAGYASARVDVAVQQLDMLVTPGLLERWFALEGGGERPTYAQHLLSLLELDELALYRGLLERAWLNQPAPWQSHTAFLVAEYGVEHAR